MPDPYPFLAGGGMMGDLMRAHDWAATALGPLAGWSPPLRTATGLLLRSPVPMVMLWGEAGVMIYNDAYSGFAGGRHPQLLGSEVRRGWPEVADFNDRVMRVGLAGGTLTYRDQELTLYRDGRPEQVWMDLSYSPVPDEDGRPAGVIAVVVETTARVEAERRQEAATRRFAELFDQAPAFMATVTGPEHRFDLVNPAYRQLVGDRDLDGRTVAEALPESAAQGYVDLLDRVYHGRIPYRASGARFAFRPTPEAPVDERFLDLVFQPIRDGAGTVTGILVQGVDVTDAHRAQAALRESEDHYRHAVELHPQMSWTATPDGQLDHVNRRWFEWTGTTGLDGSFWDALHDDDRDRTLVTWQNAVATGAPYDIEHRVALRGGGGHRWLHSRAFARRDDAGRIVKWYGSTEDVHDRHVAESRQEQLLALADRIRDLDTADEVTAAAVELLGQQLCATRAGYGEIDVAGEVVVVRGDWVANAAVPSLAGEARLLDGFGPALIAELRAGRTLVVDDFRADPRAGGAYAAAWEGIGTRGLLVVPLVRNGALRAVLYLHEVEPRRWTAGEVALIEAAAGRMWDAVGRTQAVAALRAETRVLEALNRTAGALAGELALERIVQMVTDAGVELTGAQFGSYFHNVMDETGERLHLFTLSGATHEDFVHLGRPRATGVFGPTFRNEGVIRSADILTDPRYGRFAPHNGMPRGHLPVRSYLGVPVVSRDGSVLGGLLFGHAEPDRFTDRHERLMVGLAGQAAVAIDNARLFEATERAKAELEDRVRDRTLELEQAHEALRQSQKMEAVGQLTGGIAHDFNNMLAVVIGSLDLLGRRVGDADPRAKRHVDAAAEGARRAAALTARLLAFSRQQPLRPEALDANRLVAGMSDLLRHSLGADIRLETALADGLWRTHADPNQLENAILNLAVNARDAMPDGGRLLIATRNVPLDDAGTGPHVLVEVTDTGTGMPPSVIAKAFDPFFTTKEVGKGTGLGLSQVYGFVKQTGGQVRIASEPGAGTTVGICLPRYHGADAAHPLPAAAQPLPQGAAGEVVLVVEDEAAVRQFSTDALAELGYRVLEADGAAAALRLLDAHPEVALLFTDVVMPEVNGAKLAEEARRRRPDLRVLFTTGYTRDAVGHNGALDPGVELLGKPYTVEEMAAKVRGMLDTRPA